MKPSRLMKRHFQENRLKILLDKSLDSIFFDFENEASYEKEFHSTFSHLLSHVDITTVPLRLFLFVAGISEIQRLKILTKRNDISETSDFQMFRTM